MYTTQATLKNINLRTEFVGQDDRQGAFDLKIEAPLTPELHAYLCRHTDKTIPVKQLQGSGIAEFKYGIELENVVIKIGEHEIKQCKVNNVVGKLGGKLMAVIRVQSKIPEKGLVDDLNDITGEPQTVTIDELQGDLIDEVQKPEKKASTKKKAAPKKKKVAAKKSPGALHVHGDKGRVMTEDQIAAAEQEKQNLLKRHGKKKSEVDGGDVYVSMIDDMREAKMGQGDQHDYDQLKEKVDGGRNLSDYQKDQLNELHERYRAAA